MPEKIVQLKEEVIKGQIKELIRGSVEETLNELLEAEAEKLTQAPGTSAVRSARATAAATIAGTSPPLRGMSHLRYRVSRGRLYCRLTSFSRDLQTNLRITLEGTFQRIIYMFTVRSSKGH